MHIESIMLSEGSWTQKVTLLFDCIYVKPPEYVEIRLVITDSWE